MKKILTCLIACLLSGCMQAPTPEEVELMGKQRFVSVYYSEPRVWLVIDRKTGCEFISRGGSTLTPTTDLNNCPKENIKPGIN